MAILGLLLLAAAAVFGVETAVSNQTGLPIEVFGESRNVPVYVVFLLGALTMAVATLGTFMITGSFQRRRHVRRDAKHRMHQEEVTTRLDDTTRTNAELIEENDRLRGELNSERRAAATMGGVAVPPGAGNVAYGDQVSDAVRSDTISDTGRFDPYPTERGVDGAVNTEGVRYDSTNGTNGTTNGTRNDTTDDTVDGTRHDDKAGIVGRFRGNH